MVEISFPFMDLDMDLRGLGFTRMLYLHQQCSHRVFCTSYKVMHSQCLCIQGKVPMQRKTVRVCIMYANMHAGNDHISATDIPSGPPGTMDHWRLMTEESEPFYCVQEARKVGVV